MNGSKQIGFLWRVMVPGISSALLTFTFLTLIVGPVEIRGADPYYTFSGCRYDPDSIEPISYRFFSVGSDYETAFKEAEEEWDDTTAPGYFQEQSASFDPEINVTDDFLYDKWGARVDGHCDIYPSSPSIDSTLIGNYTGNEVELRFNTRTMASLSAADKKLVAMHEIGHAYGIDHVTSGCRLMREHTNDYNSCGTDMPSADDLAGVAALYP